MTTTCARCGAEVGDASFCSRCGQPVLSPQATPPSADDGDWRTDTRERPAARVPVEPLPASPPGPARYPLYADEDDDEQEPDASRPDGGGLDEGEVAFPGYHPQYDSYPDDDVPYEGDEDRTPSGAPSWLPWLIVAIVMLLVAVYGVWLLVAPDEDESGTDAPAATSAAPSASRSDEPTTASSAAEPTPTKKASQPPPTGDPVDVAGTASANAPSTAPPNEDAFGNRTTYVAGNMLDGQPETCWRMAGDGTGTVLTFALASPTTLTRVGMINGYAKNAVVGGRNLNWYVGNRRVLSAEWIFDDGTTVDQPLGATKQMQTLDLGSPVTTSTVQVRLVAVSSPGTGRSARDYTAVSEVTLVGTPAT